MSYTVECNGVIIWEPASRVAEYFILSVKALEKVMDKESGIDSPYAEVIDFDHLTLGDTLEIDYSKLKPFIDEVLRRVETSNHTAFMAMISGVIEVLLALEAKITGGFARQPHGAAATALFERSKLVFWPLDMYLKQAIGKA